MVINCRTITTKQGDHLQLSKTEEKYLRLLENLSKVDPGRLKLYVEGDLGVSVCVDKGWKYKRINESKIGLDFVGAHKVI